MASGLAPQGRSSKRAGLACRLPVGIVTCTITSARCRGRVGRVGREERREGGFLLSSAQFAWRDGASWHRLAPQGAIVGL